MKKAVVTGTSSGIGREIARNLANTGWYVYGIGRNFTNEEDESSYDVGTTSGHIENITCDITDINKLVEIIKSIRQNHDIKLLVNNAGVGYYGLHEELNPKEISRMVRTNLEAPMVITNLLLRDLKENDGIIINISSVTAEKSNPHGCAYGATKAGLTNFSHSLFDEVRKYGVRVVNIEPDMTRTNLYRAADFTASDNDLESLNPKEVADAVMMIINARKGMAVTDITLKPQKHKIVRKR